MTNPPLLLGPMMRYVDETSASIWVETRAAAVVTVRAGGGRWQARTFAVHGHHYALVEADGLQPGTVTEYSVEVSGIPAWPDPASGFPPPVIATLKPGKPLRLAYGSCRTSVPHDESGNRTNGVDSLRAYALHMASGSREPWPDLLAFLGDQVYADSTSEQMQQFIRARRDIGAPPGAELEDYEEYAHLYYLAWSDPANRWLLSTLPSAMIFDDHDIRDDWNASLSWKKKMEATSWWHDRIVAGLAAYWVYQHLGNLSPQQRAEDEIWQTIVRHEDDAELDLGAALDEFAERTDQDPEAYRWSYCRDFGDTRLVVVDSRAARVLAPERRALLDEPETAWLDDRMRGGFRHLLVATSLPFLLPTGAAPCRILERGRLRRRVGQALGPHRGAAAAGGGPGALGRIPEELPAGGGHGVGGCRRQTRSGSRNGHVPVRGRALLLCVGGGSVLRQPDCAGGLFADPQPAAPADALLYRHHRLRAGQAGGRAGGALGEGAGPAVPLVRRQGSVV